MLKKIPTVNYKTKQLSETEVSVLTPCFKPGCQNPVVMAIIFDEPYGNDEGKVQGEVHFCVDHMLELGHMK